MLSSASVTPLARRNLRGHRARNRSERLSYLNFDTRSACSKMTRALSAKGVPVGSPWYVTRGLDQNGIRGQPLQAS